MKTKAWSDEMRDEYDFRGGVRGKYVERYRRGPNFILLDPPRWSLPGVHEGSQHGRALTDRQPWSVLSRQLFSLVLPRIEGAFGEPDPTQPQLSAVPRLALYHFASCLQFSFASNERGEHSVALTLLRQSAESLVLIAIGLQQSSVRNELLETWRHSQPPAADITNQLTRHLWRKGTTGLWNESWAEFFQNLSTAVQPYAHYTPELAGWQVAIDYGGADDRVFPRIAPAAYDVTHATRIALLHGILVWALAQVGMRSVSDLGATTPELAELADRLRAALVESELLGDQSNWPKHLVPHVTFQRDDAATE